jgi:hypothetical protein
MASPALAPRQREPRPGHGFGRRLSGVPKSLGGPWVGGCRRTPEGAWTIGPSSMRCKQTALNPSPIIGVQRVRLGRRIDVGSRGHSRIPVIPSLTRRRCRPTQLSFLHKAHSCDRHHIASAMAELVSRLSIIPHMRSFDVPPKLSPVHAGLFCAARLKGGTRSASCLARCRGR